MTQPKDGNHGKWNIDILPYHLVDPSLVAGGLFFSPAFMEGPTAAVLDI
jgi:hypothetical protein